jgi:hypothetical protein
MKTATRVMALLIGAAWLLASGPHGTVPRSAATHYPAHAELNGVAMGAALLTPQDVKRAFSTELNRCCIVVEVAIYPQKENPLDLSLDDFALRTISTNSATKPESAKLLAANLQKKAQPSGRDITVYPEVGIGVETGSRHDPNTGIRRSGTGVYTSTGVAVGVGGDPSQVRPASTDRDRDTMDLELSEKGLPEGTASTPVAGYLYFPLSSTKKPGDRQIEYTLNGKKMTLRLP